MAENISELKKSDGTIIYPMTVVEGITTTVSGSKNLLSNYLATTVSYKEGQKTEEDPPVSGEKISFSTTSWDSVNHCWE